MKKQSKQSEEKRPVYNIIAGENVAVGDNNVITDVNILANIYTMRRNSN